jgi:hypothetical protein
LGKLRFFKKNGWFFGGTFVSSGEIISRGTFEKGKKKYSERSSRENEKKNKNKETLVNSAKM